MRASKWVGNRKIQKKASIIGTDMVGIYICFCFPSSFGLSFKVHTTYLVSIYNPPIPKSFTVGQNLKQRHFLLKPKNIFKSIIK